MFVLHRGFFNYEITVNNTYLNSTLSRFKPIWTDHDHEAAYWLGGNDIEMEGLFNWVKSGKYVTYTDWTPGQPDNANDEDCMELRGVFYYHWNDFQCNVPQRFICEAP